MKDKKGGDVWLCVCVRSIIPTRAHISISCYLGALRESKSSLWSILSSITKRKRSLSLLQLFLFPYGPLNTLSRAQHVLKPGQRAGQTVCRHGNLMPPTTKFERSVQLTEDEKKNNCHIKASQGESDVCVEAVSK